MLAAAEDKAFLVSELFDEYCEPGSNTITFATMREMFLRIDLLGERAGGSRRISSEVGREDIVNFIDEEVQKADVDHDGLVSREEFEKYYNGMQDFMKNSLSDENRYEHTLAKFTAAFSQVGARRAPSAAPTRLIRRARARRPARIAAAWPTGARVGALAAHVP